MRTRAAPTAEPRWARDADAGADERADGPGSPESSLPDAGLDDGKGDGPRGDGPPTGPRFPDSFVFGASVAGFQVDMGCPTLSRAECVDPNSDWYVFTTAPETVGDPSAHLSGQDPAVVGPGFLGALRRRHPARARRDASSSDSA